MQGNMAHIYSKCVFLNQIAKITSKEDKNIGQEASTIK